MEASLPGDDEGEDLGRVEAADGIFEEKEEDEGEEEEDGGFVPGEGEGDLRYTGESMWEPVLLLTCCSVFYAPEAYIMYFIGRCWFLNCSEEIKGCMGGVGGGEDTLAGRRGGWGVNIWKTRDIGLTTLSTLGPL